MKCSLWGMTWMLLLTSSVPLWLHYWVHFLEQKAAAQLLRNKQLWRRERVQIQTFWRNKHPESLQILLWSDSVHQWKESSEITLKLLGLKSGFIFTPDCSRGDLHCWVFVFWNVHCWLELEGNCIFLHEGNVTERRGEKEHREPESLLSAELSQMLTTPSVGAVAL